MNEPKTLYPPDEEIARCVVGTSRRALWKGIVKTLEREGFPPIDPVFNARYWPAVKAFLDRRNRLDSKTAPLRPNGKETTHVSRSAVPRPDPHQAR